VATTIRFIGAADNAVRVVERATDVADALSSGGPLNAADGSGQIFLNPSAVAFWYEGEPPRREDSGIASSMSPF
jgi:hypothetical protein